MATILDNEIGHDAQTVQHNLSRFLNAIEHQKAQVGELAEGIDHFLKVTRSYWSGLFHCYQVQGLPRTNNDQGACLWSVSAPSSRCYRSHPLAPASLVLRGSVRLVAVVATRMKTFTVKELAAVSHQTWQNVRSELQKHHSKRLQQRCFRRDPDRYLAELEAKYLQLALPS